MGLADRLVQTHGICALPQADQSAIREKGETFNDENPTWHEPGLPARGIQASALKRKGREQPCPFLCGRLSSRTWFGLDRQRHCAPQPE
jgi:hypothetical protein